MQSIPHRLLKWKKIICSGTKTSGANIDVITHILLKLVRSRKALLWGHVIKVWKPMLLGVELGLDKLKSGKDINMAGQYELWYLARIVNYKNV